MSAMAAFSGMLVSLDGSAFLQSVIMNSSGALGGAGVDDVGVLLKLGLVQPGDVSFLVL